MEEGQGLLSIHSLLKAFSSDLLEVRLQSGRDQFFKMYKCTEIDLELLWQQTTDRET